MKRTDKAVKTKPTKRAKQCEHNDLTPLVAFVDDHANEAFLLQHCEVCGQNVLLMRMPFVVS